MGMHVLMSSYLFLLVLIFGVNVMDRRCSRSGQCTVYWSIFWKGEAKVNVNSFFVGVNVIEDAAVLDSVQSIEAFFGRRIQELI
jgi:hypothetical protein